jgi:hypothetical protein
MEPIEIWGMVFEIVRKQLPTPAVWLAMQAVNPLTIDGNYFVAALPPQEQYLSSSLKDDQTATAIEDALKEITGRILAFRLIKGATLADWEQEKAREFAPDPEPIPTVAPGHAVMGKAAPHPAPPAASAHLPSADSQRSVSPSWEKLNERLMHGYKSAPFIKYPHGQAQFVLAAVQCVSDTMDLLLPPPGAPRDDQQERALAKVMERLGSVVNLDPLFLSLELLRFRAAQGKRPENSL